jgi:hypothetical protein
MGVNIPISVLLAEENGAVLGDIQQRLAGDFRPDIAPDREFWWGTGKPSVSHQPEFQALQVGDFE